MDHIFCFFLFGQGDLDNLALALDGIDLLLQAVDEGSRLLLDIYWVILSIYMKVQSNFLYNWLWVVCDRNSSGLHLEVRAEGDDEEAKANTKSVTVNTKMMRCCCWMQLVVNKKLYSQSNSFCVVILMKQQQQMLKQSRKALSLQLLNKHQERIKNMVSRIERYKPGFHSNREYIKNKRQQIQKRMEKRQEESDKLLEQNIKLIYRIETTGPKIETKKFPSIKHNPTRAKTLTIHSKNSSKTKFKILDSFRNEDQLFQQNIKLITTIESTGPKITCWASKKVRNLNQLMTQRKREEQKKILEKFKEISKEFNKLNKMRSFKRSQSITSAKSRSFLL